MLNASAYLKPTNFAYIYSNIYKSSEACLCKFMQIDLSYATKNACERIFFSNNFMICGSSIFFALQFIGIKFSNEAQMAVEEKK